jgi:hypothetical protein
MGAVRFLIKLMGMVEMDQTEVLFETGIVAIQSKRFLHLAGGFFPFPLNAQGRGIVVVGDRQLIS